MTIRKGSVPQYHPESKYVYEFLVITAFFQRILKKRDSLCLHQGIFKYQMEEVNYETKTIIQKQLISQKIGAIKLQITFFIIIILSKFTKLTNKYKHMYHRQSFLAPAIHSMNAAGT